MTIEEAILHCREIAEKHCDDECGLEHKQLEEWLIELRQLRRKVKPTKVVNQNPSELAETTYGDCENCGYRVWKGLHEYCPGCGKELEWE